jgi:hypothetical protein
MGARRRHSGALRARALVCASRRRLPRPQGGRAQAALERRTEEALRTGREAPSNPVFAAAFPLPDATVTQSALAAARAAARAGKSSAVPGPSAAALAARGWPGARRLRVGFLSSDFAGGSGVGRHLADWALWARCGRAAAPGARAVACVVLSTDARAPDGAQQLAALRAALGDDSIIVRAARAAPAPPRARPARRRRRSAQVEGGGGANDPRGTRRFSPGARRRATSRRATSRRRAARASTFSWTSTDTPRAPGPRCSTQVPPAPAAPAASAAPAARVRASHGRAECGAAAGEPLAPIVMQFYGYEVASPSSPPPRWTPASTGASVRGAAGVDRAGARAARRKRTGARRASATSSQTPRAPVPSSRRASPSRGARRGATGSGRGARGWGRCTLRSCCCSRRPSFRAGISGRSAVAWARRAPRRWRRRGGSSKRRCSRWLRAGWGTAGGPKGSLSSAPSPRPSK